MINKKSIFMFLLAISLSGCNYIADNTGPNTSGVNLEIISKGFEISLVNSNEYNNTIPWGFDEDSYNIYKSGILDEFINPKSEVDQCVISDLDLDGIDDILLSVTIPEIVDPNDIYYCEYNTLILKGLEDGTYIVVAENDSVNFYVTYDGAARIIAGPGWFKTSRSRGTAGGYEYNYLFKYNQDENDWFYEEYYHNRYGYIESGESCIKTTENFGIISFDEFNIYEYLAFYSADDDSSDVPLPLSVEEDNFVVSVSPHFITLQDKEKELKVNQLISDDLRFFIDNLRLLNVDVDILLSSSVTFQSPEVISIVYNLLGSIDSTELNYSGINEKCFTTIIDIRNVRRITLKDIISTEDLIRVVNNHGISEGSIYTSETTWLNYNEMTNDERIRLLESSDSLDAIFGGENTGIFCAVYEKSICLYFQPEFFGMGPYCEDPNLYITIENALPYVKVPFWDKPSEAAGHIIWRG